MTTNCGFRDGDTHPHMERCYQAGAIEALREAADAADRPASGVREDTGDWLNHRADEIERGAR